MTENSSTWQFVIVDSLEKVFADVDPRPMNPAIGFSVFLGETASFQIAFRSPAGATGSVQVSIAEQARPFVRLSEVRNVPCAVVYHEEHDDHYLRTTPGDYPDLLLPLESPQVEVEGGTWQAIWVDMAVEHIRDAGMRPIAFTIRDTATGRVLFEDTIVIDVLPRALPALTVVNCHWLHADAIADYYRVPVFSETHWLYLERFIRSFTQMQGNAVLTPVWTPPLDTAVGGYRTPVQLMDVRRDGGRYSFEFSKLLRWMEICRREGVTYLEISHLFSQWGATKTPAIYATVDGEFKRIFGWDTSATDPAYADFLEDMLPELLAVLEENWGLDKVFFHISDEPTKDQRTTYRAAREVVRHLLEGCTLIDAMSDIEFYEDGLVRVPVVANNHILPFLDNKVDPLWTYYCVAQNLEVSNRFVSLPSARNRVIGHQLFNFDIDGFLHWGFNFYNSQNSTRHINPFEDTSAGGAFPSGDAFMVYPGKHGHPYPSIRYRVFADAMWDLRAMERLASLRGREAVKAIINPHGTLAFDTFTYDPDFYRQARETINREIMRA